MMSGSAESEAASAQTAPAAGVMPTQDEFGRAFAARVDGISVADIRELVAFLHFINSEWRDRDDDSWLEHALFRYLYCWLPLLHSAKSAADVELLCAPSDIAWLWFVHLLRPQRYYRDVLNRSKDGRFPEHGRATPIRAALRPRGGDAWTRTASVWEAAFAGEPFELPGASTKPSSERWAVPASVLGTDTRRSQREHDDLAERLDVDAKRYGDNLAEQLLREARQQLDFFYQVALPQYHNEAFLAEALSRYGHYLELYAHGPPELTELMLPPMDVELVWRAHAASGLVYVRDCIRVLGRALPRPDRLMQLADGRCRAGDFQRTCEHWAKTFAGRVGPLDRGGALARGPPPRLFSRQTPWLGSLRLETAKLVGMRLDGRSSRPMLTVSGLRAGAAAVRVRLLPPASGGGARHGGDDDEAWATERFVSIPVDGRVQPEVQLEISLRQGKKLSIFASGERVLVASLPLANVTTELQKAELPLTSKELGRVEGSLHVSFRVDSKTEVKLRAVRLQSPPPATNGGLPPSAPRTPVSTTPGGVSAAATVAGAPVAGVERRSLALNRPVARFESRESAAPPFAAPPTLAAPLSAHLQLVDDECYSVGSLHIEHWFDGNALQRREASVTVKSADGRPTALARLIGREELVEDEAFVDGQKSFVMPTNPSATLVFLLTVGERDWGVVRGRWMGRERRRLQPSEGASSGETAAVFRSGESDAPPRSSFGDRSSLGGGSTLSAVGSALGATPGAGTGHLHLRVARFSDDPNTPAEVFTNELHSGSRGGWKLYKARNRADEVVYVPSESTVTIGATIEAESALCLTASVSLLHLLLRPASASKEVTRGDVLLDRLTNSFQAMNVRSAVQESPLSHAKNVFAVGEGNSSTTKSSMPPTVSSFNASKGSTAKSSLLSRASDLGAPRSLLRRKDTT